MANLHETDCFNRLAEIDNEVLGDEHMPLPVVRASELARKPSSPRKWIVEGLIPSNAVTFFSGDGGLGKSLLALQLGVAIVSGTDWLDFKCANGPVLLVTAEDDEEEVARRLSGICRNEGLSSNELNDLHILCLVDRDATFAEQTTNGIKFNVLFQQLVTKVEEIKPRLVILDPLAAFYGGDDVSRSSATRLVRELARKMAAKDRAVLVIAHPSVDAMRNGRPMAGSTGWTNASRSVFFIQGEKGFPDRRYFSRPKSNYARKEDRLFSVEWNNGVFSRISDERVIAEKSDVDELFIRLLRKSIDNGQTISCRKARNYAPKKFAELPECLNAGVTKEGLTNAMQRLLTNGSIVEEQIGYKSARKFKLSFRFSGN